MSICMCVCMYGCICVLTHLRAFCASEGCSVTLHCQLYDHILSTTSSCLISINLSLILYCPLLILSPFLISSVHYLRWSFFHLFSLFSLIPFNQLIFTQSIQSGSADELGLSSTDYVEVGSQPQSSLSSTACRDAQESFAGD